MRARKFAADLLAARQTRRLIPLKEIPAAADFTLQDAYEVHSQLINSHAFGGVAGWKCGFTAMSPAELKAIGLAHPMMAPLFYHNLYNSGSSLIAEDVNAVEAEFGFRLIKDLPSRDAPYTEDEVWGAVGTVLPVIEAVGTRYAHDARAAVSAVQKIADFGLNEGVVLGREEPATDKFRSLMTTTEAAIQLNGQIVATGTGAMVYESPLRSLTWLANHLISVGTLGTLRVGQVVITGAAAIIRRQCVDGDRAMINFNHESGQHMLGGVSVRFVAPGAQHASLTSCTVNDDGAAARL